MKPKELRQLAKSKKIERYKACGIKFDGDDKIISYIEKNRHLLWGRAPSLPDQFVA